jgi:ABC-2 type transport system ATP-binding protein
VSRDAGAGIGAPGYGAPGSSTPGAAAGAPGYGLDAVTVRLGRRRALDAVSLTAEPGRLTVVVGADGAGKSTALRALVGLVRPESGAVRRPAKQQIGYVPATAGLYVDLTVEENLAFIASAYKIAPEDRTLHVEATLERTGLAAARGRLGAQLSGGMQRKLAVGMALLHSPALLALDEPTTGIDPVSRAELWRLITAAVAAGSAAVLTTTYVNEAARADQVLLLADGRTLASGSPAEILSAVPGVVGAGAVAPGATSDVGATSAAGMTSATWRRGAGWRAWVRGDGKLPEGYSAVEPDFEDAVVIAELDADEVLA